MRSALSKCEYSQRTERKRAHGKGFECLGERLKVDFETNLVVAVGLALVFVHVIDRALIHIS